MSIVEDLVVEILGEAYDIVGVLWLSDGLSKEVRTQINTGRCGRLIVMCVSAGMVATSYIAHIMWEWQ